MEGTPILLVANKTIGIARGVRGGIPMGCYSGYCPRGAVSHCMFCNRSSTNIEPGGGPVSPQSRTLPVVTTERCLLSACMWQTPPARIP